MSVVIRPQELNSAETRLFKQRQGKIYETLKNHGLFCNKNNVPRVALLGSGGGQRAHTGFLGVIEQLGKEELLDCILYMAGVSGSTWCMSSLYQDSMWSKHPKEATSMVLLSMSDPKGPTLSEAVEWLKQRDAEGDLSLSDVWGTMTCRIKGVPLETSHLINDGDNPYPLYSAIEKRCLDEEQLKELWFEFSPDEVGFLETCAYVQTSLLKKDFEGGEVKPVQPVERDQIDMVQVQGICGCAMGSFTKIIQYMWDILWNWIHSFFLEIEKMRNPNPDKTDVVFILADLSENYGDTELSLSELERLKTLLGENYGEFSPSLKGVDDESWGRMDIQERKELVKAIAEELIVSADVWSLNFVETRAFSTAGDLWWLFQHVLPLFSGWHFGTVSNFLYNFKHHHIPQSMTQDEDMHLIDAGLYLNSPYPSVLRPARDIDLIMSFDFSDGDPFETLRVASKYADFTHHLFPKVDFTQLDSDCPKSCYVFEEKGRPTVIHIPLFNMDNCKSEAQIKVERKEYTTFQKPFRERAKVDHLVDLAAENVKMNKQKILQEMEKAAQRRNQRNIQH